MTDRKENKGSADSKSEPAKKPSTEKWNGTFDEVVRPAPEKDYFTKSYQPSDTKK